VALEGCNIIIAYTRRFPPSDPILIEDWKPIKTTPCYYLALSLSSHCERAFAGLRVGSGSKSDACCILTSVARSDGFLIIIDEFTLQPLRLSGPQVR
jgi:hypothetical protein